MKRNDIFVSSRPTTNGGTIVKIAQEFETSIRYEYARSAVILCLKEMVKALQRLQADLEEKEKTEKRLR